MVAESIRISLFICKGSAILNEVQRIALKSPENRNLCIATNELPWSLKPEDHINQIMKRIVQIVDTNVRCTGKPPDENWPEQLNELSTKLNLFLDGEISDVEVAFEHTKVCCEALMAVMDKQFSANALGGMQNGSLLSSIPAVTRNIGNRFWEIEETPYDLRAVSNSVFPTYASLILTSSRCRSSRKFIVDGYRSLTTCLSNTEVRPILLRSLESEIYGKLPSASMELLTGGQYATDSEAVQRILEFLSYIGQDSTGVEILKNTAVSK